MTFQFFKYHGAGNDFVLIDNRSGHFSSSSPSLSADLIRHLCDRQMGIGANGVLLIEKSDSADCKMRIFNADASEPAMCGNGLRCVFDFLAKETGSHQLEIEIAGRIRSCRKKENAISIDMGTPLLISWPIILQSRQGPLQIYVLDTGVPHAVLFVENLLTLSFSSVAKEIRWHPAFGPGGVNVNFAAKATDGSIQLRTFERGVEGETLACGTGAAAAAWAASHLYAVPEPVIIKTRKSLATDAFHESMRFCFPIHPNGEKQMEMIGTAHLVFTGTFTQTN